MGLLDVLKNCCFAVDKNNYLPTQYLPLSFWSSMLHQTNNILGTPLDGLLGRVLPAIIQFADHIIILFLYGILSILWQSGQMKCDKQDNFISLRKTLRNTNILCRFTATQRTDMQTNTPGYRLGLVFFEYPKKMCLGLGTPFCNVNFTWPSEIDHYISVREFPFFQITNRQCKIRLQLHRKECKNILYN